MRTARDVLTIRALLDRARGMCVSYIDAADEYRHSSEFLDHAYSLANRFVSVYGMHQRWRALHFPV